MKSRRSGNGYVCSALWAAGLLALALASGGCSSSEGPGGTQVESLDQGESTFIDEKGRTWIKLGEAKFSDEAAEARKPIEPVSERSLDETILEVSLEEAAQMLRPRLEFAGVEYTISKEDALEFARKVRERIKQGGYADVKGEIPKGAKQLDGDAESDELEGRKIIPGYGDWYRINSSAHIWPYSMVARLDQGAGRCTAFKIVNHYTAATAGHCVASSSGNWKSRQRIQFAAGSGNTSSSGSGDEKDFLPSGCYGRVTPGCFAGVGQCDYAVFYLRGAHGGNAAWCNFNDYNVGYFGALGVGSGNTGVQTRMGSYPGTPPTGGYPSLYYHNRSDGWASGDHLRYRIDTLPGSSGAPTFNSANQVRSVHNDACGSGSCTYNYGMRMTTAMYSFMEEYGGF